MHEREQKSKDITKAFEWEGESALGIELKYSKKGLDLLVSVLYGLMIALHMVFLVFVLPISNVKGLVFASVVVLLIILHIALCGLYISMYRGKRNYIVLDNQRLIKDQGLIRPKRTVELSKIRVGRKIGNKIRLDVGDNKEIIIYLDCLSIKDIGVLESILEDSITEYIQ